MGTECLSELSAFVAQGANGTCGPPTLSLAAVLVFLLGIVGTLMLWRLHARSAIALCVLFALPGSWVLARRHVDDEPVTRLRVEIERYSALHGGCVELEADGCVECDPIARRARTPSRTCASPGVVELHAGALGGHCAMKDTTQGARLVCGPR